MNLSKEDYIEFFNRIFTILFIKPNCIKDFFKKNNIENINNMALEQCRELYYIYNKEEKGKWNKILKDIRCLKEIGNKNKIFLEKLPNVIK